MSCCLETQSTELSADFMANDGNAAWHPQCADDSSDMAVRSLGEREQSTLQIPLHEPLHDTLQCAGVVATVGTRSV